MSLPAPNLDNRTFQNLVDDAKRQIGLRCPEWTDHNVSDPGVTLIELFSYLTESMLFQLNQVPEKNHIRFLELLGVKLDMPRPAVADLRYMLTRPVDDSEDAEFKGITVRRDTVASTMRTDNEDPIEFLVNADLRIVRPRLEHVLSLSHEVPPERLSTAEDGARPFDLAHPEFYAKPPEPGEGERRRTDPAFRVYGDGHDRSVPAAGDRLLFGFGHDVSGHLLDLEFEMAETAGVGLVRGRPNQVWEVWDGIDGIWRPLEPLADSTLGFAIDGAVRLELPQDLQTRVLAGRSAIWVSCRYTEEPSELPYRGGAEVMPYNESPAIRRASARTVGGHIAATHCGRVYDELLGESDGKPGQRFRTRYAPIFELSEVDRILTGPRSDDPADRTDWLEWIRVQDFSESRREIRIKCPSCKRLFSVALDAREDRTELRATCPHCHHAAVRPLSAAEGRRHGRHFTVDELTGEIQFGPQIARPDGAEPDRYGEIPEKGHQVVLTGYAFGGGLEGNVVEGRVCVDKASLPFVASVVNPKPAVGGRDLETVEHAKMKAAKVLKVRNRAVTRDDYEALALEIDGVARATCLQPTVYRPDDRRAVPAGVVEVLLVPALGDLPFPRPSDLAIPPEKLREVGRYLDERRLLTTVVEVREPRYVYVETEIRIVADPRLDADSVALAVRERLGRFLHPLTGGPDRRGWPFGRHLTLTDLYVQIGDVRGVAFLLGVEIRAYRVGRPSGGRLEKPERIDPVVGLFLDADETICSREHIVSTVPIDAKDLRSRTGA